MSAYLHGRCETILRPTYRRFRDELSDSFVGCRLFRGYVDLYIKAEIRKEIDTDNIFKPICDALKTALVIKDDRFVRNIYCDRIYTTGKKNDTLTITLREVAK